MILVSLFFGLLLSLSFCFFAGENPAHVFQIMIQSAVGSWYDAGMSLYYATPLLFTGLSVSFALRAGLFNVGAEGQLAMGALGATACGILFPNATGVFAFVIAAVSAFSAGAMWGFLPGWLLVKRGSHEVITTIMMNFIAAGIVSWFVLYVWPNKESQNPESLMIGAGYQLQKFSVFQDAPVGFGSVFGICIALLLAWFFRQWVLGYELKAVGENPLAADVAGIHSRRKKIFAMVIAGGLAGLVAVPEVLGSSYRFKLGFSPGFGFVGIAVALLAKGNPLAVIFSALLFGALHKGASDLDFQTEHITRDFSLILQGIIILAVSSESIWQRLFRLQKLRRTA